MCVAEVTKKKSHWTSSKKQIQENAGIYGFLNKENKAVTMWRFLSMGIQRSNAFFTPVEINGACIPHSQSIWGCNRGYHIWQNYFESCYTTYNIIWTLRNCFLKIKNVVQYLTLALLKGTDKLQRPKKLRATFTWNFPALYYSWFPGFAILHCPFPLSAFPGVSRGCLFVKGNQISQKEEHLGQQKKNTAYPEKLQNLV